MLGYRFAKEQFQNVQEETNTYNRGGEELGRGLTSIRRSAADLLVAEESMAGLGSAAAMATATAREREEKYNLLHEGFSKLGAPPYGSFGVLCPRGWLIYIGRKTPHIHVN